MFPRRRFGRRNNGNFKLFITLILIVLVVIYGFMFVDKKVKPSVLAIAEVKASVF